MDSVSHRDIILDTIDQLRCRKARPDLRGICHMLGRKHRLGIDEITRDLERLCEQQAVIKVDYKGSISYRNASKWRKSINDLNATPAADVTSTIDKAVQRNPGCTIEDIDGWLKMNAPDCHFHSTHELELALDGEVGEGKINSHSNGRYYAGDRKRPRGRPPAAGTTGVSASSSRPSDEEVLKKSRPTTKRKRFKKSHGPDFESYDETEPDNGEPSSPPRCDYCLQTSERNRAGDNEHLLVCKDCQAKAHPSCMQYSTELARRAQMSPWQCIDCKTCCVCQDAGEPDAMLFCDACDKGYHMSCHSPSIAEKPTGKWACRCCQQNGLLDVSQHLSAPGAVSLLPPAGASTESVSRGSSIDSDESSKGHIEELLANEASLATTHSDPASEEVVEVMGTSCLPTQSESPTNVLMPLAASQPVLMPLAASQPVLMPLAAFQPVLMPLAASQFLSPNLCSNRLPPTLSVTPQPAAAVVTAVQNCPRGSPDQDVHYSRIPPAEWSVADVVQYFHNNGFQQEAVKFSEQEIDGKSLLLLMRNDVLVNMALHLGRALKIYERVKVLQSCGSKQLPPQPDKSDCALL